MLDTSDTGARLKGPELPIISSKNELIIVTRIKLSFGHSILRLDRFTAHFLITSCKCSQCEFYRIAVLNKNN